MRRDGRRRPHVAELHSRQVFAASNLSAVQFGNERHGWVRHGEL